MDVEVLDLTGPDAEMADARSHSQESGDEGGRSSEASSGSSGAGSSGSLGAGSSGSSGAGSSDESSDGESDVESVAVAAAPRPSAKTGLPAPKHPAVANVLAKLRAAASEQEEEESDVFEDAPRSKGAAKNTPCLCKFAADSMADIAKELQSVDPKHGFEYVRKGHGVNGTKKMLMCNTPCFEDGTPACGAYLTAKRGADGLFRVTSCDLEHMTLCTSAPRPDVKGKANIPEVQTALAASGSASHQSVALAVAAQTNTQPLKAYNVSRMKSAAKHNKDEAGRKTYKMLPAFAAEMCKRNRGTVIAMEFTTAAGTLKRTYVGGVGGVVSETRTPQHGNFTEEDKAVFASLVWIPGYAAQVHEVMQQISGLDGTSSRETGQILHVSGRLGGTNLTLGAGWFESETRAGWEALLEETKRRIPGMSADAYTFVSDRGKACLDDNGSRKDVKDDAVPAYRRVPGM